LFYHKSHLQDFLNQWISPNELLKSIEYDINEKIYIAEVRALGIIDKLITAPMWRLFESEGGILSINPYLKTALEKLQSWGNDASPIFEGDQLFMDIQINKDDIYESLFADADPELDSLTQMCIELLTHSIMLILDRQAKDQLPGGKYSNPTEEFSVQAKSLPKTNTVSERDFGSLDLLIRMKPAATTLCYESVILWTNNKTSEWLNSLDHDIKNKLLDNARVRAPEVKRMFNDKRETIKKQKLKKLKEKQKKESKRKLSKE
jgi:E1A/CREB-binding protein